MEDIIELSVDQTAEVGGSEINLHAVNAVGRRAVLMVTEAGHDSLVVVEPGAHVMLGHTNHMFQVTSIGGDSIRLLISEYRAH